MNNTSNECAFIRRAWYDTAKQHLNDNERLILYETILDYQFENDKIKDGLPPMVALTFDIIRPVLEADKEKMQRRREANRQNGLLGGRPKINESFQEVTKPSGSNGFPVGYFGLANTNPNTNTNTNTNSVCPKDAQGNENEQEGQSGDTHTKFFVIVEFYLSGFANPIEEAKLFWNYYEARGWVAGDGNPIKNIVALSKTWHPKAQLVADAKRRQPLRTFFNLLVSPDYSLFERIKAVEIDNTLNQVYLFVRTKDDAIYLEERYIETLSRWIKTEPGRNESWELVYRFVQKDE